jgi:putative transposase
MAKLFLCVELDLYSKLVNRQCQDQQMVIRAVEVATGQRQCDRLVILHSVRGNQFTTAGYPRFLDRNTTRRLAA